MSFEQLAQVPGMTLLLKNVEHKEKLLYDVISGEQSKPGAKCRCDLFGPRGWPELLAE